MKQSLNWGRNLKRKVEGFLRGPELPNPLEDANIKSIILTDDVYTHSLYDFPNPFQNVTRRQIGVQTLRYKCLNSNSYFPLRDRFIHKKMNGKLIKLIIDS